MPPSPDPKQDQKLDSKRERREFATSTSLPFVGWREWIALPGLGLDRIKAKVDTGARSSALHATNLKSFRQDGKSMVRFEVYPIQHSRAGLVIVETELIDERSVRSSSGKAQIRPVIRTALSLGRKRWPIELTLTNRDAMGFRMLIGRQAIRKRFVVDPGRSYLQG
ncbi:MAG: ATP-dependent zinc protease [Synechococcales cyanobacterium RM1_1_8]|nr:ATP-dependent zinc protease [Synechococcales cyanobacterium RM1_1_8]